jgi:hypothetical protein
MLKHWEKAIDLYEGKKFRETGEIFLSLIKHNPNDAVAELYPERCKGDLNNPLFSSNFAAFEVGDYSWNAGPDIIELNGNHLPEMPEWNLIIEATERKLGIRN